MKKPKLIKSVTKRLDTNWNKLNRLIEQYAEAKIADSWKGGGDPESYREIELGLELSKEQLNNHIKRMYKELR